MKLLNRLSFLKRRTRNPRNDSATELRNETESSVSDREGTGKMDEEEKEEPDSERKRDVEWVRERKIRNEGPPADDCCPICFGSFTVPCRAAPCGHWYCGDCILQYWNHGAALKPCKCPMCSQLITRLIPEASFGPCQDLEVLENVRKYNRFSIGGIHGFILKVLELPLLIKRIVRQMMDPDAAGNNLVRVRLFALFLGVVCTIRPVNFLPTGLAIELFDDLGILLVFILYMIGVYRRWKRLRHLRQRALTQP